MTKQSLILAITTLYMASCSPQPKEESTKPNIVVAICDDMSWLHTGYEGSKAVKTPNIDRLSQEGAVFKNAYCSTPSCTASRASLLTGRNGWELKEGAVLWAYLPTEFPTYTELLAEAGYHVGYTGKGWGPGDLDIAGRTQNPAGKEYNEHKFLPFQELGNKGQISDTDYNKNFEAFLNDRQEGQPFCFWYGVREPHRKYVESIGERSGMNPEAVNVPEFYPGTDLIKSDILDYLFEVQWFDTQIGHIVQQLKARGEYENTLILITSDNGMPFPRAKSNLYEYGIHMPLIAVWKNKIISGREITDIVSLQDLAPTILEATGLDIPKDMTAQSLMPQFISKQSGQILPERNTVYTYRERHAWSYADGLTYPSRAILQDSLLLIWNMEPDQWPAGDIIASNNFDEYPFGDVDDGLTKDQLMSFRHHDSLSYYYEESFGKRPEYELYDVVNDPANLNNLIEDPGFDNQIEGLKSQLVSYLKQTEDLRLAGQDSIYRNAPYYAQTGLGTGGLMLKHWNSLDTEEKAAAVIKEQEKLSINSAKADSLFNTYKP